ncbi:hypothetical protein [Nocardioides sp. YIM 152588]|uniref:hypothetical protein n=1 Tax=Nocardioides sp. YIM 152588 TaxID=3158259 RepID=UPI0032E4B755
MLSMLRMSLLIAVAALVVGVLVPSPRSQPAAAAAAPWMTIYFGTTHAHTGAYNDHGMDGSGPAEVFAAARRGGHDFVLLTEHAGPTGPARPSAYRSLAEAAADDAMRSGDFVALVGYEYSENGGDGDRDSGHLTGYGTAAFPDATARGMDFDGFLDLLVRDARSGPVLAGLNHPVGTGHPAAAAARLTPARRAVVVMSETSNKVRYRASDEAAYYRAFVRHLDDGWRVAPTCGVDSHGTRQIAKRETESKKPCRTGLLAPSLSRDDVVAALLERRIYSTRDANLRATYSANGEWMGSELGSPAQVALDIEVRDPDSGRFQDRITRLEVIGSGGAVLASRTFSAHDVTWRPTVAAGSNDYLFVRVFNGERSAHTAVLAPVWLE